MLQVWRGLEEQPGEDNWHNAGVPTITWDVCLNSKYSTFIQHVRLFWAAHLSMQRLQLFRQDLTNPRKLKPKHKRIEKATGIEDSPLHRPAMMELKLIQSREDILSPPSSSTASLLWGVGFFGTNKHILHLETLCQHLVLCSINLGRKKSAETDVLVY